MTREEYNEYISEQLEKAEQSGMNAIHISMPTYEEYINNILG